MAYKIQYKSSVEKDLKRIAKSDVEKILDEIEKNLSNEASKFPMLKGKFKGLRKFRVGNYRVIYSIQKIDVVILKIGHRKEVYD
ncbi:MAG: type II toxin-antitoxin system RelE/ParE family toxin [bacterium]